MCIALLAMGSDALAQTITVNIASPTPGKAVADALAVAGTAQSQFALSEAMAAVQDAVGTLSLSTATSFAGTLDITTLPIGPHTLTVTVKDAFGTTGSAQVAFVHDRPPSVMVTSPLDRSVARPTIRLAASCADLDIYGCTSIKAAAGASVLASGTTSFDQVVSLDGFEGQALNVAFTATDAAGLSTTVSRTVFVESSPRLFEVDAVEGQIVDFDASRILYSANGSLRIRTRGTQTEVTVLASGAPSSAYLTTFGALWNDGEWNGTQVVPHTTGQWVAKGSYACGVLPSSQDRGTGVFRDLSTGSTTTVFPESEGLFAGCSDIAENGDAIFVRVDGTLRQVYRYRAGSLTRVSNGTSRALGGLTDGTNVAFQYQNSQGTGVTRLYTTQGETGLGGPSASFLIYQPRHDYALAGGRAAFTDFSAGSPTQVFLRSANGAVAAVAPFATNSELDWGGQGNAATQGDVIHDETVSVINGGKRYLAKPADPPDAISSALGGARYVGSDWHVVIGRHLFKVVPPGFDAGAPDAGPDDSGISDAGPGDGGAFDGGTSDGSVGDDASTPPGAIPGPGGDASSPADPDAPPPPDGPDDGGCSAGHGGPISAGAGPALLAVLAVLRLARRARRDRA